MAETFAESAYSLRNPLTFAETIEQLAIFARRGRYRGDSNPSSV